MIASLWRRMIRKASRKTRTILNLEHVEDRLAPAGLAAVGSQPGTPALVTVYDADSKAQQYTISPFPGFTGGVNVALGDVTGDGTVDVIVGAGAGGGPIVNVYDGTNGTFLKTFVAGAAGSRAGVSVAAGDIDQDGFADIVTGAINNGQPLVQVFKFSDLSVFRSLTPFTGAASVTVASGDVNGDGTPDIVAGSGANVSSAVAVFSGTDSTVLRSFNPFESTFLGGVYVAAGDVNADNKADVIVAASVLGGPRISVFSGLNGVVTMNFFAYDSGLRDGTFAVAYNANSAGNLDVATTNGPNNTPDPKAFDSTTTAQITASLLPGLPITTAYDIKAPTAALSTTATNPTAGNPIPFTATFSEAVNGFATAGLTVTNGTAGTVTRVNAKTYTFSVTPAADGAVSVIVAANAAYDAAGNRNTASTASSVTFDGTPPTVTANNSTTADQTPTLSGTVGESTATVSVNVGGQTFNAVVSGTNWTATVPTDLAPGTYTITATAADTLGNDADATASLTIDIDAPTVDVTTTEASPTSSTSIVFHIAFSEDVTGFVQGDVSVGNGTIANFSTVNASTYDVTVTPTTDGDVTVSVLAGRANDIAGNQNTASNTASVTYDNTDPTVASIAASPSTGSFDEGATVDLTVTFSEPVVLTGGTVQLLLDTGATVALTQSGSNAAQFTGTYTVAAGENSPDLASTSLSLVGAGATLVDAAGNTANLTISSGATLAANADIVIDTTAPVPSVTTSVLSPTSSNAILFQISFSEDVTGFVQGDVTVGNGSIANFNPVNGSTYDVTVTPTTDGDVTVSVLANLAADAAGNQNTASNTASVTFDGTAPTVQSITTSHANGTFGEGETIDLTVAFSEPVVLTGGTIQLLLDTGAIVDLTQDSGNPALFTGTYTVSAGENSLHLDSTSLSLIGAGATLVDAAGNTADLTISSGATLAANADIVIDTSV